MRQTGRNKTDKNAAKVAGATEIGALVQRMGEQLFSQGELKASVTDFIRLLQLYRELDGEAPREIRVQWVDKSPET